MKLHSTHQTEIYMPRAMGTQMHDTHGQHCAAMQMAGAKLASTHGTKLFLSEARGTRLHEVDGLNDEVLVLQLVGTRLNCTGN